MNLFIKNNEAFLIHCLFNFSHSIVTEILGCSIAALIVWLGICYTMRYTLKLLLMYKGWMYESRGPGSKVSLKTKLWVAAVRIFSSWNKPGLYSFQGSLPRLPLPKLEDTMQRVSLIQSIIRIFILSFHYFLF